MADKFQFGTDFQQEILKVTATDKNNYKIIQLYQPEYFTLLTHKAIAFAFKRYFKATGSLPNKIVLREELRKVFRLKSYSADYDEATKNRTFKIASKLYATPSTRPEDIIESTKKFARFTLLKEEISNVDLLDFDNYDKFQTRVQNAITFGHESSDRVGTFVVGGIRARQTERKFRSPMVELPYRQWNKMMNGNGSEKGSLICILGKEKDFKTGMLINIARARLRRAKKILYIDLENNESPLATRAEQSIARLTKEDILLGKNDLAIQKIMRRYQRIGAELYIKRLPAYHATCNTIQAEMDKMYREYGIKFDEIVLDFIGLLGALSGAKDDLQRISDATVDFKNLLSSNQIDLGYTAMHVTREGEAARKNTCYIPNDIAKCKDIGRHVDMLVGINSNDNEDREGVMRVEMIEQRDGLPFGRVLLWVDKKTQHVKEFTIKEEEAYKQQMQEVIDSADDVKRKQKNSKDL
jgi:hypothetical protein